MILIAEDNPHFSATIKRILESRGYIFDIVDTGKEALARIAHHGETYALMIVDEGLPDITGLEVIEVTRTMGDKEKAFIPVILMTGGMSLYAEQYDNLQIATILYKPFLVSELVEAIQKYRRWSFTMIEDPGTDNEVMRDT